MFHGPKLSRPEDAAPAGKPDECFYCQRPFGEAHGDECVIPQRTVVLRYTVTVVQSVPSNWTPHDIEFHRNESSWCADNLVGDLEGRNREGRCLCNQVSAEFIREASADDEQAMGFVAETAQGEPTLIR